MTYGMQVYATDGSVSFNSSSFGGVPVTQHKQSDGSYITQTYLDLDTTNSISSPLVLNYSDYPGRKIKVVPINSGDTYYQVIQPNDGSISGFSAVNYARIAYFTTSDFTPTLATHGFTRVATTVLVLLT
ncbi:hypothetical protein UFOVP218_22 [uncultured Caudovirales phage]|uniref:Uncharacterized protein n=1 Tax=uncultured Caudovirales phage TaxID=2100421 RepID=A0A6J7WP40_9CAUD|nr:hypothetical protein UFOVP218_22 [uncultured Caudovirales phage]